ncbi:MAG: hypothetical protein Q7S35_05075, partial [Candidatus Limnocylindrales bacterium]|nr:hypothetical protein [Candidatus Limnocylindrales bacterium]
VARGLSSTWAGLAPATGPAASAADPLEDPRRWYAFVPAPDVASPWHAARPKHVTITELGTGTAIRTQTLSLEAARATLAPILPDDIDVTLYPIDD